ncbi:hypothetical protein RN001_006390 [Aquatica leii]|uniref:Adenylyltransferase and sulfurtransferase MOCS3 homolog n=1 Tax=Aquatica leii TaxID=1421715 RepID=A0AAN7PL29_9COLE|nr:hypothetical protein RN001_006390 [Aquatica leii]
MVFTKSQREEYINLIIDVIAQVNVNMPNEIPPAVIIPQSLQDSINTLNEKMDKIIRKESETALEIQSYLPSFILNTKSLKHRDYSINGYTLNNTQLPEEIILHILSQVEPKEILKYRLVCLNWNRLITSYSLWAIIYDRKYKRNCKKLPWYLFYCLFSTKFFDVNLLKNGNGQEGLKYWRYTDTLNNEFFEVEETPILADPLPAGVPDFCNEKSCFAANNCYVMQPVTLGNSNLFNYILNNYKPHLYLSEWVATSCFCNYNYKFQCGFFGSKINEAATVEYKVTSRQWKKIEMCITDYPERVEKLLFEYENCDQHSFQCEHGNKKAGGVVKLLFDSIEPIPFTMLKENEIDELENEIRLLKLQLKNKENRLQELQSKKKVQNAYVDRFSTDEVVRYSRQMLIPSISISGQIAIKESKVLIVGAGGLGCPAALYLAAAGVGELTIVDNDEVELSNLHRQILHSEVDVGISKVKSASHKLLNLNSSIKVNPIHMHVDGTTLMDILNKNIFNVVVDGTDNVATRYLLNDACVLKNIPLVSGSALQMEGQLTVYNYNNGPCYRCIFPVPPPPDTVTSCGDGGVLGAVPGVIGVLQALETIKIISNLSGVLAGRLLLFDGADSTFRNVKLRNKNNCCAVCGSSPTITELIDYEQFCGAKAHDKVANINILEENENIDVRKLSMNISNSYVVVDVRPEIEFKMCHLPDSINVPYLSIERGENLEQIDKIRNSSKDVYVICRRGNDSQRAVSKLKAHFSNAPVRFLNVKGGFHSYAKCVDTTFPVY